MSNIVDRMKDRSLNADRADDKGFVNPSTSSSMIISGNGNVTVAASKNVQYKLNYSNGQTSEISYESNTITNRKSITTDEVVINNHKLNPQVYELTDMKELFNSPTLSIGNMTVNSTVLVKAWEPTLERWVLIRRPARTPLFLNELNLAAVPEDMDIDDSILEEIKVAQGGEQE